MEPNNVKRVKKTDNSTAEKNNQAVSNTKKKYKTTAAKFELQLLPSAVAIFTIIRI
jgi:hypothetical protein